MHYKSLLAAKTDDILTEAHNRLLFEILMQEIDTLFDYNFQEVPKLKLLNINIIQSEYGISIDQRDHIIKKIIQEYWVTKTKDEVKFQKSHLPVDPSPEKKIFMATHIIGEGLKNLELTWRITQSLGWWTHAHHCSNSLRSSIPYHASQWIHGYPKKTRFPCSKTWNGIYNAPSTRTYHVFKK